MAWFDDQMAALDAQYVDAFGEQVVYVNAQGARTTDTGAFVDEETVVEIDGKKVRERKFSFRTSRVSNVQLNGHVLYDSEEWPVVSIDGKDGERIYLTCRRREQMEQHRVNRQREV